MRTKRLLLVLSVFIGVAFTARWWLPATLKLLSVKGDLIQALDSTIGLISNAITVVSALGGYLLIRDQQNNNKSDSETLEHRNRRVLLGHVENAWIKGVLDASLHGAALLDLGIKEDPEAVTQYLWAIKKESTDETLPAGTSMLEIFDSIGMGRSLLILGAPGSGKTTMLLELARQLIARAREDVTYPIPMVFNLASWTEKLTIADWLAQELNNLYSVPRKTAPNWVKGDKLLLLLDGLDEVRQDSRAKCVEAINEFRKEHGLTSLAVCSRSQDYADLNAKLSFEGAIEVQPLTQKQIAEFFNGFGKEMTSIKQVLKKDNTLREMAETPLFLSIMIMAYRNKQDFDIFVSKDEKAQRKHLFDTYIERMLERSNRKENLSFKKDMVFHHLNWLAGVMIENNLSTYHIETTQPEWLRYENQYRFYHLSFILSIGLVFGLFGGLFFGISNELSDGVSSKLLIFSVGILTTASGNNLPAYFGSGLILGLFGCAMGWVYNKIFDEVKMIDKLEWSWKVTLSNVTVAISLALVIGFVGWLAAGPFVGLVFGISWGLTQLMMSGLSGKQVEKATGHAQHLRNTLINAIFAILLDGTVLGLITGFLVFKPNVGWLNGLVGGLFFGLFFGLFDVMTYGGTPFAQHYSLRFVLGWYKLLPWNLLPFLDHCVDLIFLRRVGGGYIFVHRLLMEHFAK